MIFTESAKMKLDLEALNIFVQIVESGSISGAAQRLDMPVSAVSRSLSRLEQHLGLTLLQRSTRRMEITDEGYAILQFGGGCNGCSMVDVTLKEGIEKQLLNEFPELKGVRDLTEHQRGEHSYY